MHFTRVSEACTKHRYLRCCLRSCLASIPNGLPLSFQSTFNIPNQQSHWGLHPGSNFDHKSWLQWVVPTMVHHERCAQAPLQRGIGRRDEERLGTSTGRPVAKASVWEPLQHPTLGFPRPNHSTWWPPAVLTPRRSIPGAHSQPVDQPVEHHWWWPGGWTRQSKPPRC